MKSDSMSHSLPPVSLPAGRMSLSLFWTIDRDYKEQRAANNVRLHLCPVNGRSCRRSGSLSSVAPYPPHERLNFIMLSGRVFDAPNYVFQSLPRPFSTINRAPFRLTNTNLLMQGLICIFPAAYHLGGAKSAATWVRWRPVAILPFVTSLCVIGLFDK